MKILKKLSITGILAGIFLAGCANGTKNTPLSPISQTAFVFNTVSTISLYDYPSEEEGEKIISEAFLLCTDYEHLLSRTFEGSDIWEINHSGGVPFPADAETLELLELALYYGDLSGGAFDVTLGRLSEMWDFTGETPSVPDEEEIREALSHTGSENIVISGDEVYLKDSSAHLDLGGIAKGLAADKVKDFLVDKGISSGIINFGGNVVVFGGKTDEKGKSLPFDIGIADPKNPGSGKIAGYLSLKDGSVVTSGNYERYFEEGGQRYHHILNPKTGYPAETGIDSVTIVSERSADGDALSTACFVLGLEKGIDLIENIPDTEAVFITDDGQFHFTSGAEELFTITK